MGLTLPSTRSTRFSTRFTTYAQGSYLRLTDSYLRLIDSYLRRIDVFKAHREEVTTYAERAPGFGEISMVAQVRLVEPFLEKFRTFLARAVNFPHMVSKSRKSPTPERSPGNQTLIDFIDCVKSLDFT